MEIDVMQLLYNDILPQMAKAGFADTHKNRHAYLIYVRASYLDKNPERDGDYIVSALTEEIIRIENKLPI